MIEEDLQEISMDYLMSTSLGKEIQTKLDAYEKIQETLYFLATSKDEKVLLKLRVGTVLIFNVVNRIANGKLPGDFTKEDWREIANAVADNAINVDNQRYSEYVFLTYAEYIEMSASTVSEIASEENVLKIQGLATELRNKALALDEEQISENAFIEDCLWISLEAMIKLLAVTIGKHTGEEVGHLIDGISSYAFEYGRLVLYRQEQEILAHYIKQQKVLDEELQEKYDTYLQELQAQSNRFEELVSEAFDSDFRNSLKGSIELARAAGVTEGIVESVEDVDSFFME